MPVLDNFRLAGKVAVVTGGNRGLGRAFATPLGEAGARVAILARDTGRSAEVGADLDAHGMDAKGSGGEVTDRPDVDRAVDESVAAYGRVDVLVNNAGTCFHRAALEVPETEWRQVIDVNVTGVWNGCQ